MIIPPGGLPTSVPAQRRVVSDQLHEEVVGMLMVVNQWPPAFAHSALIRVS